MDTVLVHNTHQITTSDTISAVITNIPEKMDLSENVMSVYDSLQYQLALNNSKIDTLYILLQEKSAEGWGVNQILALVAIPLIIAVFAFTLPLIINSIAKIERLYQTPEITAKLSGSWQLWTYKISVVVGLIAICILPFCEIYFLGASLSIFLSVCNSF